MSSHASGDKPSSPWNSLEIAKLVVGAVQALAVVGFGASVQISLSQKQDARIEEERKLSSDAAKDERVLTKRAEIWSFLAPRLNSVYSYVLYVGKYRELSASDLVKIKRDCDSLVYSFRSYLTDEFFTSYQNYMSAAFQMYNDWGVDAKPRALPDHRAPGDRDKVSGEDNSPAVHEAYYALQAVAAKELDLPPTALPQKPKGKSGE